VITTARPPCDELQIRGAPSAAQPCAPSSEPWILAATILGSSIVFIDGTVVSVALPVLQAELGATVTAVQWVFEAYALVLASLLLVGGSLGDRLGRRRMFVAGVVVFGLASVACGLAPNIQALVGARVLQGIGAAMLTPGSLAIIGASFADDRRGRAIGTWSSFTAISSAIGPPLGGWLIEHASWRMVFFINVPIAVVVIAIALRHVPESRDEDAKGHIDRLGALLATLGLGGMAYGVTESGNGGLANPTVLLALAVGVVALVLLGVVEARSPAPMVPIELFRSRSFTGANILTLLLYGALSGLFFLFPFNLLQVQGYSTTQVGLATLPFVFILFALSRWSGGLVDRVGSRIMLVIGPSIVALACLAFALPGVGGSYWTTFFPAIVLFGIGMGITVAPLTTTVMRSVSPAHTGIASGINNAVSRTAGLLAVAIVGVVALAVFNRTLDARLEGTTLPPAAVEVLDTQRGRLGAMEFPPDLDRATGGALSRAVDEAAVAGFRSAALLAAALALASAITAAATIDGQAARRPIS
jgi:EmrB/QacA subfamily drug resistance transporter